MKRLKKFELIKDDSEGELPDGYYLVDSQTHIRFVGHKIGNRVYVVNHDGTDGYESYSPFAKSFTFHHRIEGDRLVPPTPKPRVWQRIEDVPEGVVVGDNHGDQFARVGEYLVCLSRDYVRLAGLPGDAWDAQTTLTSTGDRVEIEFGECDD